MGFLSGRVAFVRYRVGGSPPGKFTEKHITRLSDHASGSQRKAKADGVEIGWIAGDHIFDTNFELLKNVVNTALHFCFRIDSETIPADLARAYYQIELKGLLGPEPGASPNGRQKREAREAAKDRLEKEAKDGRFVRRKSVDVLWDGISNELLIASPTMTVIDQLMPHFKQTFGHSFEPLTSGRMAFDLAGPHEQTRSVDDARPSEFVVGATPKEVAWDPDENSRDFLGNEFLLWLWFLTDTDSDTVTLSDDTEVAIMLARSLTLECPRGQTGKETISSEGPARLPEARRAVKSGKLPRKCGLTLVRHDAQYEFAINAETLAVSGAKLPPSEEESAPARRDERITQIRHLIETLDLLFDAFCKVRTGPKWKKELAKMQAWLKHEGKVPASN